MPASKLNLTSADDVREWLEFYGTATARLGSSLVAIEQALSRGSIGSALYYVRNAKVTHSILAAGISQAAEELAPVASSEERGGPESAPQLKPST